MVVEVETVVVSAVSAEPPPPATLELAMRHRYVAAPPHTHPPHGSHHWCPGPSPLSEDNRSNNRLMAQQPPPPAVLVTDEAQAAFDHVRQAASP